MYSYITKKGGDMDPLFPEYDFVRIKPIGKTEIIIRKCQIYELNGPGGGRPAIVGIIHSFGKKEEVVIPIFTDNYMELREILSGLPPEAVVPEVEEPIPVPKFDPEAIPAIPV
jgi:hypothetical protein